MPHNAIGRKATAKRRFDVPDDVDHASAELLLPMHLLPYAAGLSNRFGHWRGLIAYLVGRHRGRVLKLAQEARNLRFKYQSEGLDLCRVSYLPLRSTRVELRMLSFASRVSMCALVVLMMEWERESEDLQQEIFGVTIKFQTRWSLEGKSLTVVAGLLLKRTYPPPGK